MIGRGECVILPVVFTLVDLSKFNMPITGLGIQDTVELISMRRENLYPPLQRNP
jgi:hypothetical protein